MWDSDNSWNDCDPNHSGCGIEVRDIGWYKAGRRDNTCWHSGRNNNLLSDGHVESFHWGNVDWDQIVGPWKTDHNGVSCLVSW
jgi:prepilin-type processing-associated H-X9-DG protein